ncbi:hypothetical protein CAMA108575_06065 [Catellicoccus marimammalium]
MNIISIMERTTLNLNLLVGKKGAVLSEKISIITWQNKEPIFRWVLDCLVKKYNLSSFKLEQEYRIDLKDLVDLIMDCNEVLLNHAIPSNLLPTFHDREEDYGIEYQGDLLFTVTSASPVLSLLLNTEVGNDVELSFLMDFE